MKPLNWVSGLVDILQLPNRKGIYQTCADASCSESDNFIRSVKEALSKALEEFGLNRLIGESLTIGHWISQSMTVLTRLFNW